MSTTHAAPKSTQTPNNAQAESALERRLPPGDGRTCQAGTPQEPCPLPALPERTHCVWHQAGIRKSDPYVALLLERVLALVPHAQRYQLCGLRWQGAKLVGRDLSHADLRDAQLSGSDLRRIDLSGAQLRRADLSRCDLRGARLAGADLAMANLYGADLRGADLSQARLDDAILLATDLRSAVLTGASLEGFAWNQRTRFSGIQGFEALPGTGDNDVTQRYVAPLALSARNSDSRLLASHNPELDRTHIYRSPVPKPRPLPAAEPVTPSPVAPVAHHSEPAIAVIRVPSPALRWALAAAVLVCCMASGLAVWQRQEITTLSQRLAQASPLHHNAPPPDTNPVQPDDQREARLAEQQRLVTSLQHDVAALREQHRQDTLLLQAQDTDLNDLRLQLARGRVQADDAAGVRLSLATLQGQLELVQRDNQRLHNTARILDRSLRTAQQERDELLARERTRTNESFRHAELESEVNRLRNERGQLASRISDMERTHEDLRGRLAEAERSMSNFLARIEGSRLAEVLVSNTSEAPLLPISAEKPLVLGGDYLVTLRVSPSDRMNIDAGLDVRLVIQRPAHRQLPDCTLILYDDRGEALRSLALGFPGGDDGSPFSAIQTHLDCPRFPSSVRLLVHPPLDARLLASATP